MSSTSTSKNKHYVVESNHKNEPAVDNRIFATKNECSLVKAQHHVLREKMPNNNYNHSDDWLSQMNYDEALNITGNFIDVNDATSYDHKVCSQAAMNANVRSSINATRKFRNWSDSDGISSLEQRSPWTNAGNKIYRDNVTIQNHEQQVRKAHALSKKPSPPTHRVLLYNSQSPRFRELRKFQNKSPVISAMGKQFGNTVVQNKTEFTSCYVNLVQPLSPKKIPDLYERSTTQKAQERFAAGADNINNNNSNAKSNKSIVVDNYDDDNDDNDDDDYDDLVSEFDESGSSNLSSDAEDGYRSHAYKLTNSLDRVATTQSILSAQTSEENLKNPNSLLVPSLFPHVPPYLAFSSNTHKGPSVPAELYRILKWRVTNVMPKVVRCVLANSGMRLLKKTNDWMGTWGKHLKSPCFKTIRPYQKINHLPGSFKIGRKDACWKSLQKQMCRHGKKDFGFMPKTYIIPNDLKLLRKNWPKYSQRNVKWIIKPPASARGAGIRVVSRWAQIPKRKPLIVQKYIERPLLINGSKFDLRLYVLVTSVNPLRVFMYHNGLARFASVKYSDKTETLNDRCMHLTNYSINKFSSNYSKNEDVNACHGHKWTLKSLWTYLANRGVRTDFLWEALRNLVLRTIIAGELPINNMIKMNVESKYSCFELFGFDVLLDSDLIPWLLEVNISPSLHSDLQLDEHVKAPLVQGVLNAALFNVPPKLSLEKQKEIAAEMLLPAGPICYDKRIYVNYLSSTEKIKHNAFTRKIVEDRNEYIDSILNELTPDDVRCLIVAEDELARSAPLERIFPTKSTHKYLKYTESPRYYNRLLDAWETRYANNRSEGIALLRDYCEEKYHLEVPPPPAKKHVNNRPRALMMMRLTGLALSRALRPSITWRRKLANSNLNYKHTSNREEDNSSATESEEELQ